MTNKEKYREFCITEKNISIFSKDWWLDAVCGEENWDVCLVEKGGQVVATMPYYYKKEGMFNLISMPDLTQTLGPYIKYPKGQKYYKKLSWEKEMMYALIDQLPVVDSFNQNFSSKVTNWLPFYWKGYQQSTRYTYVIENISSEELEQQFETDIRRRRRKAQKQGIIVIESDDIEGFYQLNQKTFQRQGMKMPYSFALVNRLYQDCKKNNACKIYCAKDQKGAIIAAAFLVYDEKSVYYLMGGIEPAKKDIGGMDIVLYESIQLALKEGKKFDFEGSMIESIEKYFRSFGAIQVAYHQVYKTNSKLWKLKGLWGKVLNR